MTPQEAITFLKETKVGCNIAISALERLIPKKVKKVVRTACNSKTISEIEKFNFYNPCNKKEVPKYEEYKYNDYLCPVCNALAKDGTPSYCWRCGQALDLGDESDSEKENPVSIPNSDRRSKTI